jgi:hypothetical protein
MAQYADIVEIEAPGEAVAGARVDIKVYIKNLESRTIGLMVGGALEYGEIPWPTIEFPNDYANFPPGETYYFAGYFTMPDSDVTIHAYSYWYGVDSTWHFDDEDTKDVSLAGEPPPEEPVEGTITRKELEYDESRADIPASNVPEGKSGLIHIWGRNDTDEVQQMGISWTLVDPDGVTRESYSDWEAWPHTGAGDEHEFIGGRFDLDKTGVWRINVQLYMNPDSPAIVDSYEGDLCTVVPSESEFNQFEIADYQQV